MATTTKENLAETEKLEAEKAEAEKLEAEKAEAEKLEAEKAEAEKLEAEKNKPVDKDLHAQYAYLTKLLNINHELTPDETVQYAKIVEHTGFTPETLLKIVKDPSCKENIFKDAKGKEHILLDDKSLLIISKALAKKITKDVSGYTEKDRDPKVWEALNFYGVTLTDLKSGPKALMEKVVDPKTGEPIESIVDKIIKGFERICLN